MPVQIVIAGKAHPLDVPGKTLIREIVQFSRDPELAAHVIFVEDYGIHVARELVQGVDVWLNTPRRGEEACGTSGMKAGINGVLNMSILDGWFDEAAEVSGGWVDRRPRAVFAGSRRCARGGRFIRCSKTKSCRCTMRAGSRAYRWNGCGASNNR